MTALQVVETTAVLRIGLKGPQAANWLQQQALPVPEPWRWLEHQGLLLCRLGQSEFVLEAGLEHPEMLALHTQLQVTMPGVYPVMRYDASWLLAGAALPDIMAEFCGLDWQLETAEQRVCMTTLGGIHVKLIQVAIEGYRCVRLWCDGSYRDYLHTLMTERVFTD